MNVNVLNISLVLRIISFRICLYLKSLFIIFALVYVEWIWRKKFSERNYLSIQNRSEFETEHGKICPFSSQIRRSIAKFKDMYLHLLVWKKLLHVGTTEQSPEIKIKRKNLVILENGNKKIIFITNETVLIKVSLQL